MLAGLSDKVFAHTGGQFSRETVLGKWTVLFFYPKDHTSGCTQEVIEFRDLYQEFIQLNAQIFGVSRDGLKTHENFRQKQGLPFELISDDKAQLCEQFGVLKEKKMFGRVGFGIERSTFLINPAGECVASWRKVKVAGHAQAVLEHLGKQVNEQC